MTTQEQFEKIWERLDELNKRLFADNGGKSLQTRINENAIWMHVIKWFVITVTSGTIIGIIGTICWMVKSKFV